MEPIRDHPGVQIPPPLLYLAIFAAGWLLQQWLPLPARFFDTSTARMIGIVVILLGFLFNIPALRQFFKTNNTLITVKPATSLQTTGIYAYSRNPMYLSLLLFYTGASFLAGNWWTLLLLPVLFFLVQEYVIKKEEKYLSRRFGQAYREYRSKVRRWL